ncbi:MAG: Txe/YoeB family addiction module toxin [Bacteroidetes bacterium]|nr:MAG: Txe/YoeB family addiction module toxin [Bacteroidota bacterium]
MRAVEFSSEALKQFLSLQKSEPDSFKKLLKLVESAAITPFEGIGKPEELKYEYKGFWSRRITDKHRLVYEIIENRIRIIEF